MTLSTAESLLVEAVEGALLPAYRGCNPKEIAGLTPRLTIRVNNMSAMQLLNGIAQGFCGVAGSSRVGQVKDPLPVESSIELYVLILMLVVCAVAFWEAGRACRCTSANLECQSESSTNA